MIIKTNVTLYRCEHCNKNYQRKHFCEAHEKACSGNPDNQRACFDCDHLKKEPVTITVDQYYGQGDFTCSVFYCDKVKSYLYPPKVEHKGNCFESADMGDGEISNKPMLRECDKHKLDLPF